MITTSDDYFARGCGRCPRFDTGDCSTRLWAGCLAELRRVCRAAGPEETVKWGHPCYVHAGRNIAIIGAFRAEARLSFFNAALLRDPGGLLERQGPNARHADALRFTAPEQVVAREAAIRGFLTQAMAHAEAGTRPPTDTAEIELPDELVEALDCDPDLAEAFHALTPGRQRSYVINLAGAKASTTRTARILRFRDRILAGKGANER